MEDIALKLKSHSTRLEACKEIFAEMKNGNINSEERNSIIEVLKEPWVCIRIRIQSDETLKFQSNCCLYLIILTC